jgi:hypothetical protein
MKEVNCNFKLWSLHPLIGGAQYFVIKKFSNGVGWRIKNKK